MKDLHNAVARLDDFAMRHSVAEAARVLAVGIGVLAFLGTLERLDVPGTNLFDFDGEGKPLALWTALVLISAGALAVLAGRREDDTAVRRTWFVLGGFFAFMGVDEAITLHEHVQDAANTDWQILWLPVVAVGGVAWLLVLRRLWPDATARLLLLAGAACWFLSQVSERYQSNPEEGRVEGYGALSGIEETLEVTGSALFLLALLGTLHRVAARRSEPAVVAEAPEPASAEAPVAEAPEPAAPAALG